MNLLDTRLKITELLGSYHFARKTLKEEKTFLKKTEEKIEQIKEAQIITQQVAQTIQQQAHNKIEGVVSKCLEAVFDEDYKFRIDFARKRGRTEAALQFLKNGHLIEDPLNEDSGGVVTVAALALRLACIVLSKPALKRVIIMDEPFGNLDMGKRYKIRELLLELADKFKVQFIIVTHEQTFQIGKVIKI